MSLASRTQKTIEIPFERQPDGSPHTATIQKLSGRKLAKAAQASFDAIVEGVVARGGAKVQKELQELFKKDPATTKADVDELKADPLSGYDLQTLIRFGVIAWTHDAPCDVANFEDLDDEEEAFLAREVLRLTKPHLFEAVEGEARKNGSSGSVAS